MYLAQVTFKIIKKNNAEVQESKIDSLLGCLRMNGNILGREMPLVQESKVYRAYLSLPDKDAFQKKTFSEYVGKVIKELSDVGLGQPEIKILGKDPQEPDACECRRPSWFILFTNYVTIQPPLRCGRCFSPFPLYRIPKLASGDYYEAICWQSNYQACDTLQMNCEVGERFGTKQMSDYDSSLTKEGLKVCREIERVTKKKVYYYLFRYNGKSHEKELEKKCPNCGGDWLLKKSLHKLFDFKCDKCRLLSNIAMSL